MIEEKHIVDNDNIDNVYDNIFDYIVNTDESPDITITSISNKGNIEDIFKAELVKMSKTVIDKIDKIHLTFKDRLNEPIHINIRVGDVIEFKSIEERIIITGENLVFHLVYPMN